MSRVTQFLIVSFLLVCSVSAQQQSPLPELPSDIPKDAVMRTVLSETTPSGQDAVWKAAEAASMNSSSTTIGDVVRRFTALTASMRTA